MQIYRDASPPLRFLQAAFWVCGLSVRESVTQSVALPSFCVCAVCSWNTSRRVIKVSVSNQDPRRRAQQLRSRGAC